MMCVTSFCVLQLASGEVFGKNQPIALQLLGSNRSREALEGVAMELEDSLYPLLREVSVLHRCDVLFFRHGSSGMCGAGT